MARSVKEEINTIPYDAPLSFPPPTAEWLRAQSSKGLITKVPPMPDVDLSGKWIIVTGGNSGIGREATLQFAKWGANIIIACRFVAWLNIFL